MSLFLDVLVVAVVAFFAIMGARRGFIKEIVSIVGIAVALVAAFYLSIGVSNFVFDRFVKERIHTQIAEGISVSAENSVESVVTNIPEFITNAAKAVGVDINESVSDSIGSSVERTAGTVADSVTENVARPFFMAIIRIVAFLILYTIIRVIIHLLAKVLNLIAKLPVLNSANKLLGFVAGLIKGLLIAAVICFILAKAVSLKDGFAGITPEIINSTVVFGMIANLFVKTA